MHFDLDIFLILLVLLMTQIGYTHGYPVYLGSPPEAQRDHTVSVDFSLLPRDAWTYTIRNAWQEPEKQHHLASLFLDGGTTGTGVGAGNGAGNVNDVKGAVWWDAKRHSLTVDRRKISSPSPLTVIIEAKSVSLVSLIPVTVHLAGTTNGAGGNEKTPWTAAIDYPHVIQRSRPSGQTCGQHQQVLNLTEVLPYFVRQRGCHVVSSDRSRRSYDNGVLVIRGGGQTVWRNGCDNVTHTAYHSLRLECDVTRAEFQIDVIFAPDGAAQSVMGESSNQVMAGIGKSLFSGAINNQATGGGVKHRRRRHRRARATSLYFASPSYTAFVLEEFPPPAYVVRMNASSSAGKGVRFSMAALADSRSQALFMIDPESGVITTESQLDREVIAYHYFRITAVSDADKWTTATTTLTVKVLDINDNVPIFETTDYNVSISESADVGTVVVTVHAGDSDEGGNGQVVYSLINDSIKGKNAAFEINAKSGVISTRLPLDREALEQHLLYVRAEDQAGGSGLHGDGGGRDDQKKSSIAKILIRVTDENDNTPHMNSTCRLEIREDLDWTTLPTIVQLHAIDEDHGLNGQIRFSIVSGNPNGQFILDPTTGDLKVGAPLDYESERRYRLVIRIQDLGSPPRSNTTTCTIEVLDSNDNEPKFSTNMYSASLAEDVHVGYPVVQTQAYDPEGRIVYSIKNQSTTMDMIPFAIDAESGWITTSARLDRERQEKYELTVMATDLGSPPRSSSAAVQIMVLDVNDNGPVFDQRDYNISMSESAVLGTQLLSLRAQDRDLNARLTYQIISGSQDGRFSIINQNGLGLILLTKTVTHRKAAQKCELLVEVADESGKNDRVKVVVHILAANLHRPTFLNAPFRIQILESIPTGTTVIELKAVDEDAGENGRITYSMSNDLVLSDSFHLDAETGVLTTKKALDRELHAVYTVPVTASDHGAPALHDTTDVLIELIDVNDNPPVFSQKTYFVAVKEDVSPQTSILQVSAVDADFGLNGLVVYAVAAGGNSANGTFSVDAALGIVRTNIPLDRELHAAYELIVLAIDRGTPPLTASVTVSVKILDVNDNAPVFSGDILNFYAPENLTMGSTVAEILASDPDEGANAAIDYYIIGGPDADSFALVTRPNNGPPLLSNLIELDHEGQKRHYKLVIRASSPPLQTDVTVNIFVTDVNDNAPVMKDFRIVLNSYPRHFPHGVIGRVPVTDRDATAKLEYRITTGNRHSLLLVNPTNGDIQLSASLNSDVPYSAKFTVEVTDGLNTVSAICTLTTVPVDEEMLAHSITIQAANVTARDLLEPVTYDRLVESLSFISVCPPESIFIFGIIDEMDTRVPVVNVSFFAKPAGVEGGIGGAVGKFVPPETLRERLFVQRKMLQNMTSIEFLPLDDNLCLHEPCPNFEQCRAVQKFTAAPSRFTVTDTFFFRSVHSVSAVSCNCPTGFTGMAVPNACDTEINMCFSNPCGANGTCVSTEGSYNCICAEGFTGSQCEINLETSGCSDAICAVPAKCAFGINGRTECVGCPDDDYHSASCELTTRSFSTDKRSYAVFPGINSRNRVRISLSIATTRKSGLIAYNGRFSPGSDFFALEIVNGSAQFAFSLGRETGRISVPSVVITDGEWHHIDVQYINRSARISVDHCDHVLALERGKELDYHCAATTSLRLDPQCTNSGALCHRFLDLTGPLYVGGLPEQQPFDRRLTTRFFDGCVRDLRVDERMLDMNGYIEEHSTSAGCQPKEDHCLDGSCLNGGTCSGGWGKRQCKCLPGYSGHDCSKESKDEFHLDGDGYMLIQPSSLSTDSLDLQLDFRTTKPSGILFSTTVNDVTVLAIELAGQYLLVRDSSGNSAEGETRVTEGDWHTLRVTSHEAVFAIFVDGEQELEVNSLPVRNRNAFSIVLGGKESAMGLTHGFTGCIRSILSFGRKSSLSFRSNVQDGCSSSQRHCLSSPCHGEFSQCTETGNSYRCTCQKGYIGKRCKDICTFNPCKNGICLHAAESRHGYQCRCFANYTGDYCEEAVPQACAATWWGYPVCGPCQCDVVKGFDPVCNKLTGACQCKSNYYQPQNSDRCVDCQCNPKGSLGNQCDADGQCPCRFGVSGKRCNMCPTWHGELTNNGCDDVYGVCPGGFDNEDGTLWWERASFGTTSLQPCPVGSTGIATRTCDQSSTSWTEPNLTNCSSTAFEVAESLLEGIRSGLSPLDAFSAIRIINEVRSSLNCTASSKLFQHDLHIAKELIASVLEYELLQSGMNLTHRLDKNYLPELVESISQILEVDHVKLWPIVRHQDATQTVSSLVHLFQKYVKTVALHAEETYLRPFEIVARNLKIGVYPVETDRHGVFTLPKTFNQKAGHVQVKTALRRQWSDFDPPVAVGLPKPWSSEFEPAVSGPSSSPFSGQWLPEITQTSLVFYVEYADLPALLIGTSNQSQKFTPVSRTFFFGALGTDPNEPSVYELQVLPGKASSAQCVSWDFVAQKWTTDGCAVLSRNGTHVNCSCSSERLVAAMTENRSFTNVFRLTVPVFLFNTVVLVVAVVVHFVCLTVLLATGSKLDFTRIAQNMVLVALVLDLVFLLVADVMWGSLTCKVLAALLHLFFLSRLCWCLSQAVHLYQTARDDCGGGRIRLYLLIGYGIPAVLVGLSVGLQPESYGTDSFCWMLLDDHLILSLVGPATGIIFITLILLMAAHCAALRKKRKDLDKSVIADLRRNFFICVGLSMFFVGGLGLVILGVNFRLTTMGYVYPACAVSQAIFMLIFLCLRTREVGALMNEKVVWFVRRKFDSITSRNKNNKMTDSIRETYRNPGIAISDSTTYHRTAQPDKDISGSFGASSVTSTMRRSDLINNSDAMLEPLNEVVYSDSHKESDGTNEDTISVQSDFTQETHHSFNVRSADRNDHRSPYPGLLNHRAVSSASTFGAPLASFNSLPHGARSAQPNSPVCYQPRNEVASSNLVTTFATFRPPSKSSQNVAGHLIDTVTGEILTNGSESAGSQPSVILPPEPFRTSTAQKFADLRHLETGTAV
ncbi:Protocadherin-like wing polarity protein stan [Hypsibius exemplaris]|uniref:Protocadherin-like wing polarity protein stan n=1 Tax=Hypsibius exemplaris TaxID=2072580 RepID=A0A1W0X8V3_HYPEX|nr:Protocadherin-like wing polarity protein stan [Hypsibius exemplaris]